jgi:hypothetical protein
VTLTTEIFGYLEDPYLEGEYGTSTARAYGGLQTRFVIADDKSNGVQTRFTIESLKALGIQSRFTILSDTSFGIQTLLRIESNKPNGVQSRFTIKDYLYAAGLQLNAVVATNGVDGIQTEFSVDSVNSQGIQYNGIVSNFPKDIALQYEGVINSSKVLGIEARSDRYPTRACDDNGYLDDAYLSEGYLAECNQQMPGLQANFVVTQTTEYGLQARLTIKDALKGSATQARFTIADFKKFLGVEFDAQFLNGMAIQFLAAIYNTDNLRILCDFDSRGVNNNNWTASSTAVGDFNVNNVNTDIVEQVWRSIVTTGVTLSSDTGVPQGTIIDTLAILNHNLTSSATVTLIGSNNPGHAPTGIVIPLEARANNLFYIAPTLPSTGFRYWRIAIDDATNPDGFLQIGAILYGTSQIFQGECFVDEIEFSLKDFADTVATEGFTNVANSRAIKRNVKLDFRSLEANDRNFKILRDIFENIRTTLKCLWIPTPDPTDQEITAKFATFGKIPVLPSERHNSKGRNIDYVSMTIEVDESL